MTSTSAPDGPPTLPLLRWMGRVPYEPTVDAMKAFTANRGPGTADEIWVVEHDPVFTQGLAGRPSAGKNEPIAFLQSLNLWELNLFSLTAKSHWSLIPGSLGGDMNRNAT